MTEVNWSDGAAKGIGPGAAMKAAISGEDPGEPQDLRSMINGTSYDEPLTYDSAGRIVAKMLVDAAKSNPAIMAEDDLYGALREMYPEGTPLGEILMGMSGFQWGWAHNAARTLCEMPEVQNPALVVMGDD